MVSTGDEGGIDPGPAKRLLEEAGTTPPEPKRVKAREEHSGLDSTPTKQKGPKGKRNEKHKERRRGTRPQPEDDPDRPKTPRLPKKQCAVLIGFSGTGYAGMQM